MQKDIWHKQDNKLRAIEKSIKIPDSNLSDITITNLDNPESLDSIPKTGDVYWILTNAPINHALHNHPLPNPIGNMQIIYNGIAKDNIQARTKHYLLNNDPNAGWSAISVDIFMEPVISHKKAAMDIDQRRKVPNIEGNPIYSKEMLLKLFLSDEEKKFITTTEAKQIYFRNGINIFDEKHSNYEYQVGYISDLKSFIHLDYIEKKWRKEYCLPRLCTYSSGR